MKISKLFVFSILLAAATFCPGSANAESEPKAEASKEIKTDKLSPIARLEKSGFKKLPREKFSEVMSGSLLSEPKNFQNRQWYLHDGDCSLDGEIFALRELQGINLIVKGNLEVRGVLQDKWLTGIIVTGNVTADSIVLSYGPIEFRKKVLFKNALLIHSADDQIVIGAPVGKFVLNHSDSTLFIDLKKENVEVFVDQDKSKHFGSVTKILKPEFIAYADEEGVELDSSSIQWALLSGESIFVTQ